MDHKTKSYNILVPTDFSKYGKYGLKMALQISEKIPAKIHLMHWVNPPSDILLNSSLEVDSSQSRQQDIYTLELVRRNKKKLKKLKRKYQDYDLDFSLIMDDFSPGIEEQINQIDFDLIVMGTSGERSIHEILSGNHAEQVAKLANCPLVTVRKFRKKMKFNDIILAVDLTDHSSYISEVMKLANLFQATIHLVYVDTSSLGHKKEAIAHLKLLAIKNRPEKYTLNYIQDEDEVAGIRHIAHLKQSDLVAIVTERHRNFLVNLFNSDPTYELIKTAKRPVISINIDE